VVLVEGDEDKALIEAAASLAGSDPSAAGIAVVPVRGKTNIDRVRTIFLQLGIRVFVCFDGDGGKKDEVDNNRRLLRLLGAEAADSPATQLHDTWACFEQDLQTTVQGEFGASAYQEAIQEANQMYGFRGKEGQKNPTVLRTTLERLHRAGGRSAALDALVAKISSLQAQVTVQ